MSPVQSGIYMMMYDDFIFTDDSEELTSSHLLHRKSVASAFWAYQIENELTEENRRDYVFNGSQAQEKYMEEVDIKRANSVYHHGSCSDECKRRGQKFSLCCCFNAINIVYILGCGQLWVIDGNWKLHYPICMFDVQKSTDGFSNNLNYVKTCPNGPEPGKAFCSEHADIMKKAGVPIALKEYLNFKKQGEFSAYDASKSSQSAAKCQGKHTC